MSARRLPNGNLLVPLRAEGHGAIGDSVMAIGPDHEQYEAWLPFVLGETVEEPPDLAEPEWKTRGRREPAR